MNEIQRLVAIRDAALNRGDKGLALEAQVQLWRLGFAEAEEAVAPLERAVKRKPGRPRKVVA